MPFALPALAAVGVAAGASTATAAATGATIISTAVSVIGAGVGAYASHSASKAQAASSRRQAEIADENARRSLHRSQVEQQDQDLVAKAILGELSAQQGASGLAFGSGSFASQRKSAQTLARKDALNIRQGGEIDAYNFRTQAGDARFEAAQAQRTGRLSLLEGFFDAGSSLIGGASQVNRLKAGSLSRDAYKINRGLIR